MTVERESWAWEKDLGFDAEGHQRKEACRAIAECPVCGAEVELIADTEAWTQGSDGRWYHSEYSPSAGVCCHRLIVDDFNGCKVFRLPREPHGATEHRP